MPSIMKTRRVPRHVEYRFVLPAILALLLPTWGGASEVPQHQVEVYGEYSCDESNVVVDVMVDVHGAEILSAGVTLGYDPADLEVANAAKHEDIWYFGNEAQTFPYIDPVSLSSGEVVLFVGKLDTDAPEAGVVGAGVPVGSVRFDRRSTSVPSLSLTFAETGRFENFVAVDGTMLDDEAGAVHFGPVIARLPGDANGDESVDGADYTVWADHYGRSTEAGARDGDFNGDGLVDGADYTVWADHFGARPCNLPGTPSTG
jgi:hypothetical protein